MTTRRATKLPGQVPMLALLGLLGAGPVVAQDAPHWSSTSLTIDCTTQCHTLHQALGGGLTSSASNVNLCQSCPNPTGDADGLPIFMSSGVLTVAAAVVSVRP